MSRAVNLTARVEQAPVSAALRHKPFVDALLGMSGPRNASGPAIGAAVATGAAAVDTAQPARAIELEVSRPEPLYEPSASEGTAPVENGWPSRAPSTRSVPRAATRETLPNAGQDQEIGREPAAVDAAATTPPAGASVRFVPSAMRPAANIEMVSVAVTQGDPVKPATIQSTQQSRGDLLQMASAATPPAPTAVSVPASPMASEAPVIGELAKAGKPMRATPVAVALPVAVGRRPVADAAVAIGNQSRTGGMDNGAFDLSLLRNHLAVLRRLPDGRLVIQVSSPALGRIDFEVDNREGAAAMVAQASRPDVQALLQSVLLSAGGPIGRLSDTGWRTLIRQPSPTAGQLDEYDEPGTSDTAGAGGKVVADGGALQAII